MPQCSVPLCTNQGGHRFPKARPQVLRDWLIKIKRDRPDRQGTIWVPGPAAVVCKSHFTEDSYVQTSYHGKCE